MKYTCDCLFFFLEYLRTHSDQRLFTHTQKKGKKCGEGGEEERQNERDLAKIRRMKKKSNVRIVESSCATKELFIRRPIKCLSKHKRMSCVE